MSYGRHKVTLDLAETPTDILESELQRAWEGARKCEEQGSPWHDWTNRANAIQAVLDARRRGSRRRAEGGGL